MRHDERGTLGRLHDIGDGESLARAGRAQQSLMTMPAAKPGQQTVDGDGLIASRDERSIQFKFGHGDFANLCLTGFNLADRLQLCNEWLP